MPHWQARDYQNAGLGRARQKEIIGTYLWLYYLQIPNLNAARGKVRYFELNADWPLPFPSLSSASHASPEPARHSAPMFVISFYRREAQLCAHEELFAPTELLDLPYYSALFWRIVHATDVCAKTGGIGIFGDGDEDFDVIGCGATFELGARLEIANHAALVHAEKVLARLGSRRGRLLTLSVNSILDPECERTSLSTHINGFTCVFSR